VRDVGPILEILVSEFGAGIDQANEFVMDVVNAG
jgi:hypothetical protein